MNEEKMESKGKDKVEVPRTRKCYRCGREYYMCGDDCLCIGCHNHVIEKSKKEERDYHGEE
jgi:hypothetical protein